MSKILLLKCQAKHRITYMYVKLCFSKNILKFMFNSNEFKAAKDASSISYICMLTRLLISTYLTHSTISKMQRTMMEDTFLHLTWSNTFSTLYITLWLNFRNCPLWMWCKNPEYLFILPKYRHWKDSMTTSSTLLVSTIKSAKVEEP